MRPAAASALWLPLAGLLVFGVCFSATLGFLDVSIPDVVAILWARLTDQPLPAGVDPGAATGVAVPTLDADTGSKIEIAATSVEFLLRKS